MIRLRLFALTLLALNTPLAVAGIDLTPAIESYTSEGIVYSKVQLKTDTGSVTFVPPRDWKVSGGKEALQMQPPDGSFAEANIAAAPLNAPAPAFDEQTLQALEQEVLGTVPPASQSAGVVGRQENSVMSQYPNVEITISYVALGRTFHRSVIFINTPDTRLTFRFTAPKQDFAALSGAFRRSIGSWQWAELKPTQ